MFIKKRLLREITVALIIKLILLYLLWFFFFSHVTKDLSAVEISDHFLSNRMEF